MKDKTLYNTLPWKLVESGKAGGLKIVDVNNKTLLYCNWAMVKDLNNEQRDELYDMLKTCVLEGNNKNKKFWETAKKINPE